MPLRYVRKRLTAENTLSVVVATTAVAKNLADMMQFPPASAAAGILLLIFQTIQEIQSNRTECYRLARRCLTLLTDLKEAMEGRHEDAPPALLRSISKFEQTLRDIYQDFKQAAEYKWHSRLLKKNDIEAAIAEYNSRLDDAANSFQITTLIDIHYTIGRHTKTIMNTPNTLLLPDSSDSKSITVLPIDGLSCDSPTSYGSMNSTFSDGELVYYSDRASTDDFVLVNEPSTSSVNVKSALPAAVYNDCQLKDSERGLVASMLEGHDDRGFRRYHQTEIVGSNRSTIETGWWAGGREVTVEGKSLLLLPYTPGINSARRWMRDVKILQNVYHPNLPQMVGYSGTDAPTPFILLANVQTRLPQAMILEAIQNTSLLTCAKMLCRFYRDLFDAAIYTQRQLGLDDSKIQDYVEHASFRINAQDTVVMGLPPPEIYAMTSWRNYGLAHSIRDIFLHALPNRGFARRPLDPQYSLSSAEIQLKTHHLAVLAKALLPDSNDHTAVSAILEEILGDDEDSEDFVEPTLPLIRRVAIEAKTHTHTWSNNFVPAFLFTVGDIGYIPLGEDFGSFVVLGNIIKDDLATLDTTQSSQGFHTRWKPCITREEIQPFPAHGDYTGWPVLLNAGERDNLQVIYECSVLSVSTAWQVLLDHAQSIASKNNVKPEELMLVTRSGIDLRFVVQDHRPNFPPMPMSHAGIGGSQMQPPGFGVPGHNHFGGYHNHWSSHHMQQVQPSVMYVFTGPEQGQEHIAQDSPVLLPSPTGAARPEMRHCFCGHDGTYGFMNYVQLHAEDFQGDKA